MDNKKSCHYCSYESTHEWKNNEYFLNLPHIKFFYWLLHYVKSSIWSFIINTKRIKNGRIVHIVSIIISNICKWQDRIIWLDIDSFHIHIILSAQLITKDNIRAIFQVIGKILRLISIYYWVYVEKCKIIPLALLRHEILKLLRRSARSGRISIITTSI